PDKVILPSGAKRLQIHYTALSFSSPEKITYRQRIEGVDRDWVEVGTERVMTIHQPRAGAFRFRVTAANADGVWNKEGASLAYSMPPLFWQTGWFRSLAGSLVIAQAGLILALVLIHWRSSQLRTELHDNQERLDLAIAGAKLGLWTWDIAKDRFWA